MKGGYEYVHESSDWQTKITNDVSYNTDVYRIVGMGSSGFCPDEEYHL